MAPIYNNVGAIALMTGVIMLAVNNCVVGVCSAEVPAMTNAVSDDPAFTEVIDNITIPAGRNIKLACSVENLGSYKVAWIHFEQSAILTVHNQVITRNPRISVTHDKHDKHRTWFLHINSVREEDHGRYMCQINTVTAKTQVGYLHVVVPPNILDNVSSSDITVREGDNVTLKCQASGNPEPSIKWKRDDNSKISISKSLTVLEWENNTLELTKVSRNDMGAYLCIASNGVRPSVSKRIQLSVDFPPSIFISQQLIGMPIESNATIECIVDAHPPSMNYWTYENGMVIPNSTKHKTENIYGFPVYKSTLRLTIYNLQRSDGITYRCVAKNSLGEADPGVIRLYTSSPSTTTMRPSTTPTTIRKPAKQHNFSKIDSRKLYNGNNRDSSSSTNNSTSNNINNNAFIYGQSPTVSVSNKDHKSQSNLNEIDKSEQKLSKTVKDNDWPSKKEKSGCKSSNITFQSFTNLLPILMQFLVNNLINYYIFLPK